MLTQPEVFTRGVGGKNHSLELMSCCSTAEAVAAFPVNMLDEALSVYAFVTSNRNVGRSLFISYIRICRFLDFENLHRHLPRLESRSNATIL